MKERELEVQEQINIRSSSEYHHCQERLAMSSTAPLESFSALPTQREGVLVLNVDSSWASGVAALVFDIIFLSIIRYYSQLLCSSANLALVYDRRRPIRPATSKLSALTGGPTGPILLVRLLSVLVLISTAAVIVLGFCINGETVATFHPETYGAVTNFTGVPIDIDYRNEFEVQPKGCTGKNCKILVSKRLLALTDPTRCLTRNSSHGILYSVGYKNLDLDGEKQELKQMYPNATCISDIKFNQSRIIRSYEVSGDIPSQQCRFKNITDPYGTEGGGGGDDTKETTFEAEFCDYEIQDMMCYKTNVTACAGWGKIDRNRKASYFIVLVPDIDEIREETISLNGEIARGDPTGVVSNVAYFSALGFRGGVYRLVNMAASEVLSNVSLQQKVGTKNVSTIDLRIAVPAFAIIATTTVSLAVIASLSWTFIVLLKGRRKYNKFCSIPEILALTGEEMASKFGDLKSSRKVIGISRRGAHLLICDENLHEECTGSNWLEEEIP